MQPVMATILYMVEVFDLKLTSSMCSSTFKWWRSMLISWHNWFLRIISSVSFFGDQVLLFEMCVFEHEQTNYKINIRITICIVSQVFAACFAIVSGEGNRCERFRGISIFTSSCKERIFLNSIKMIRST